MYRLGVFVCVSAMLQPSMVRGGLPKLKVSENGRFLSTFNGKPFFYLGDTAWELFHRLNREEAVVYLRDRAEKRFNVIQAVCLAEFNGLVDPNAYGETPLAGNDPTKPNDRYFRHVDFVVDEAEKLGLYIGMLPTWGDKVGPKAWGQGPEVFNPDNARIYGEFLGRRYRDKAIIWILGGDRRPEPKHVAIWRAMAEGIRRGDGGDHLMTFHPTGSGTSAEFFHDDSWLSFNMQQNGHSTDTNVWDRITREYQRKPTKPVLDGEPLYEDHPIGFKAKERGYSNAADVRKFAYWDVFAGACGHTYGNHAMWQFHSAKHPGVNGPLDFWTLAKDAPGAAQMQHLRALIESRPYFNRIPDQSLIASDASAGAKRLQATRAADGSYAFIYTPVGRPFSVRLDRLTGPELRVWWFDPRSGRSSDSTIISGGGVRRFLPPALGENTDSVLVIDSAARGFGPPGQVASVASGIAR